MVGFIDYLFGISVMFGYWFVLCICDLLLKWFYVFDFVGIFKDLCKLVGGKICEELIVLNWFDFFCCVVMMVVGKIRLS